MVVAAPSAFVLIVLERRLMKDVLNADALKQRVSVIGSAEQARRIEKLHDSEMAGFGDENLRLIDAALKDRFPFDGGYPHLAEFLEKTRSAEWLPGQREQLLTVLGVSVAAASGPAEPNARVVLSGEDEALLEGVSDEDRARYAQAKALFEAQDLEASWASLEPLLEKYPGNYAIQHFGCSLAMHVGARESAGSACRRAIDLAGTQ